ncbi:MAG: 30S ribosomal protein S27e, partial [Thermoplasmatales archaeon]|nr:30S ribosomal protein S27e [Thermoplasmatales archaeon]
NEQVLFNKSSTVVSCHICGSKLAIPDGGKAIIKGEILEVIE